MKRYLVYIAGPIMRGNLIDNIRQAHDAAIKLVQAGFAVICPHGSCFWGNNVLDAGGPYEDFRFAPEREPKGIPAEAWYEMDSAIVPRCDALLRLPGEGKGSDQEVYLARLHGKPVYFSVEEVVRGREIGDIK